MPPPPTYQARLPHPWQSRSSAWCCWALHYGWPGNARKTPSDRPLMAIAALAVDGLTEHPARTRMITAPNCPDETVQGQWHTQGFGHRNGSALATSASNSSKRVGAGCEDVLLMRLS